MGGVMKRTDGRDPNTLRPIELTPGFSQYAEGSVLIKQGSTTILCNASVLEGVPDWKERQRIPGGWITAEYAMLPRATTTRATRETTRPRARSQEIRRLIGRSVRSAVDLELLGSRTIILDCDVLQADGGTRTASVTGGYLSMALAIQKLIRAGKIDGDIFLSPVAGVSVGIVDNQVLLDLNYAEDSAAQTDMNIVMNSNLDFIEVQASAEGSPISSESFQDMLALAKKGITDLLSIQKRALDEWDSPSSR
jgi:ribonuclease PH